jgi:hypothetical protein
VQDIDTLWLPAGAHTVEPGNVISPKLIHFTGDLKSAVVVDASTIEFAYQSQSRAIALLERPAKRVEVDGESAAPSVPLLLPRGQHLVRVTW